jgi:hypothetical protein
MRLSDWTPFFSAETGAAAALVGLVTVAISINLNRILEHQHLPARAGESLFALTTAFVICGVALFPALSPQAFGVVALALSAASLAFGARNQIVARNVKGAVAIEEQILGGAGRLASALPILVGAAMLLDQAPAGVAWIAGGVVATLAVAVMNAWVLLVEIMR